MAAVFGLDFGTTNSLAAIIVNDAALSFTDQARPVPSVVQYHGGQATVGRDARESLANRGLGVIGDVVTSPKRFLGLPDSVMVGGVAREPADIAAEVLREVLRVARARNTDAQQQFDKAVLTVPVRSDGRARRDLRESARKAGIEVVQFVHEPLAALYGYLRSLPDSRRRIAELEGKTLLVFDWGGGTLDLTLCRVSHGIVAQIQNRGTDSVGGDEFDQLLVRHVRDMHRAEHGLAADIPEVEGAAQKLLAECEEAKIALSERDASTVFVANFLHTDGPGAVLEQTVTRATLLEVAGHLVDEGLSLIDLLLESAGVNKQSVALCLATGGMVNMPMIRERLEEQFGPQRVPGIENGERIIAEGAAWIAADERRLTLSKPIELLHADDSWVPMMAEGVELPTLGTTQQVNLSMYCVDPRDGFARFLFARPARPGHNDPGDARKPYVCLLCGVDPAAWPMRERLHIDLTIDQDLIVTVAARSEGFGDRRTAEIHDLEFGLALGGTR